MAALSPRSLVGTLILLSLPAATLAQATPRERPPEFASPEVREDRSVALRLFAPQAKSVKLSAGDMPGVGGGKDLTKAENGVWEVVVAPLDGGTYRYHFQVDGVPVVDPRNPATSESNANSWSLATVPGSPVSDLKDVPHGAVAEVPYFSKSLGRFRRMHVYTPPGYSAGSEKLPVFYLLHGASDSDASWGTVGKAGLVLDNLIAEGKAVPMVVAMPMGHTGPFSFGAPGSFQKQMQEFAKDFAEDVRPFVEKNYRVSTERRHRAIAGLSMGGAQTIDVAMAAPADYGYVGVFSSGVFGIDRKGPGGGDGPTWEERHKAALDDAEAKKGLKLVWFATGKDDFLVETSRATVKLFQDRGFPVTYKETDGGHTWVNWREHYLPEFARAIFRDEATPAAAP